MILKLQKIEFFQKFYIDPGVPGGHPRGSRTDSGAEKDENNEMFLIFQKFNFLFELLGPFFALGPILGAKATCRARVKKKHVVASLRDLSCM